MRITLKSGTVVVGQGLKLVERDGVIEITETEVGNTAGDLYDDLLEKQITELEFPIRVIHCLHNIGVNTLGELLQKSKRELLLITNFGSRSLQELEKRLAEFGITLH